MRLVALSVRLILAFSLATSNKTWLYSPSKLTTPQVCHSPLRELTHNTINIRHFQVSVNFLTTPNDVYRPSPWWCQFVLRGRCVVFNKPWKLSAICYNFIGTVHLSCYRYVYSGRNLHVIYPILSTVPVPIYFADGDTSCQEIPADNE